MEATVEAAEDAAGAAEPLLLPPQAARETAMAPVSNTARSPLFIVPSFFVMRVLCIFKMHIVHLHILFS